MTGLHTPTKPAHWPATENVLTAPDNLVEKATSVDLSEAVAVEDLVSASPDTGVRPAAVRWLLALRCGIGWHSRQWFFVADGECTQASTCGDCTGSFTRQRHEYRWNYMEEKNCYQVSRCGRCKEVENVLVDLSQCYKQENVIAYARLEYGAMGLRPIGMDASAHRYVKVTRFDHERWGPSYSIEEDMEGHKCLRCGKTESWRIGGDD